MIIKRVDTLESAQIVRSIRNQLRKFMTQDQSFITSEVQSAWYGTHLLTTNSLFLYYDDYMAPIGYGYIRNKDNKKWGTLAVLEEFQNSGYGTQIYNHLFMTAEELWLEIFSDNSPSLIAALKNGFTVEGMDDKVLLLRKSI